MVRTEESPTRDAVEVNSSTLTLERRSRAVPYSNAIPPATVDLIAINESAFRRLPKPLV